MTAPGRHPDARAEGALFAQLTTDLGRYGRREAKGQSVLLGGHRGAGKTTLIRHAARVANGACPHTELLLVELPAPLLLGPDAAADQRPELLRGLAVGLFDALFRRTVERFRERLAARGPLTAEQGELIAQLSVELPRAPSLSRLRALWEAADLLDRGIFADAPQAAGQGAQEIAALWFCLQIYLMATGTLQQTLKDEASAERAEELKRTRKVDGSAVLNPLLGLAAAAFTGYELSQSQAGLWSALGAVITGVGATTVLNLTVSRSLRQREERSVSFTPHADHHALARHLPQVITRLGDAGVRPVFLIDEIDKLHDPLGWLDAQGDAIKFLLTQTAFFVFLVDQPSYEALQARAAAEPLGPLHSRFTQRLYLTFPPTEFRAAMVARGGAVPTEDRPRIAAAALLRACGNPLEANRSYDRLAADPAAVALSEALLRQEARLQHLIEAQLTGPLRDWIQRDSWHWQLAFDALYALRRAWAAERPPPTTSEALRLALGAGEGPRAHLLTAADLRRLGQAVAAVIAALEAQDEDGLPPLLGTDGWRLDAVGGPPPS